MHIHRAGTPPSDSMSIDESIASKDEESLQLVRPEDPPDGGLTAWLQALVMFWGVFNSWGIVNAFGVYQEYYNDNLLAGTSPGTISWVGALQGALTLISGIMVGPLLDAGHLKVLVLAGGILQSFSWMMLSLCTKYYQILLAQGICSGIACSICFITGIGAVTPWFRRKRNIAIGVGATGGGIGGTIYSIAARQLVQRVGFAWSARIIGFIALGTQIIGFLVVKRRLAPRRGGGWIEHRGFKDIPLLLSGWSFLLSFAGIYTVYFYLQLYALSLPNADRTVLIYTTAMVNAGSTFGRLIPNYFADEIGPVNVFTMCTIICMILCYAWKAVDNEGGVIALGVLLGFFSGPVVSLSGPIVAAYTEDLQRFGVRLSFAYVHAGVGVLVGPPMAGILLRKYNTYLYSQMYAGSTCALAVIAMIGLRFYVSKHRSSLEKM